MRYKEEPMKQYLLSVYQPGGDPPPPEFLEQVGRDLDALNQELKAAGAWVFAEGSTPRARPPWCGSGTAMCSPPTARSPRARSTSVGSRSSGRPISTPPSEWGRRLTRATTLPVEVRPFQGEAED